MVHRREGFSASPRLYVHRGRCWAESCRLQRDEGPFRSKLCPDAGSRRRSAGKFRCQSARAILRQAPDRTVMLFGLLLTLGVAVLSVAVRSYQTTFAQKLGALGLLIASFLAVYFITGNAAWRSGGWASWRLLRWRELIT